MGLAIAIIYVPIFLVCSIISIFAAYRIYNNARLITSENHSNELSPKVVQLLGMTLSIFSCLILLWTIPVDDHWNGFIENLAISLFGPMSIGFSFLIVSVYLKERKKVVFSYLASGSFCSVPIFPIVAYYFFTTL